MWFITLIALGKYVTKIIANQDTLRYEEIKINEDDEVSQYNVTS